MKLLKDILTCIHPSRLAHTRTLLCLLGMSISACCMTTLLQCTQLSIYSTQKEWTALSPHLYHISVSSEHSFFHLKNYQTFYDKLNQNIVSMSPILHITESIQPQHSKPFNSSIIGINKSFINLNKLKLITNNPINKHPNGSIFIGWDLAKKHQKDPSMLLGKQWIIKGQIFYIAGILNPQHNSFIPVDFNRSILINLLDYERLFPLPYIDELLLQAQDNTIEPILNGLRSYFHKPKFFTTEPEKLAELSTLYLKQSHKLMYAIAFVSLLMGGLGIMTMMFGMISQRRREIGLRLTLGANPKHIQILFLAEGTLYGLLSSVTGCILGYLVSWFIASFNHWSWVWFVTPGSYSLLSCLIICIIFSTLPARKASQLQPINILRHR
jgi:putative ABC transport system permease protein